MAFRGTKRSKQRSESDHLNLKLMWWVSGGILWPKYDRLKQICLHAPQSALGGISHQICSNKQPRVRWGAREKVSHLTSKYRTNSCLRVNITLQREPRLWFSERNQISFRCRIDTMRLSWLKAEKKSRVWYQASHFTNTASLRFVCLQYFVL